MRRREFLTKCSVTGLYTFASGFELLRDVMAAELSPITRIGSYPDPALAFRNNFDQFSETLGKTTVSFDKKLPDGLSGTLYRNGPARMLRGDTRYHHWFDGDGMVQSFHFDQSSLTHHARMIRTTRYIAEEKAGRFLWNGFGTTIAGSLPTLKPDDMNVANIAIATMGDELLALWEGGSAWKIDPDTLETLGRKVFSEPTDGVSFSAHPRPDPDGHIWNYGYLSGQGKLVLYDIAANGMLNRASMIDAPNTNMVHDFAVTEHYLVFALMPITYHEEASETPMSFSDRLGWDESGAVIVILVEKSTLTIAHRFELPSFFAFHFGNAWEDGDQVRLEVATSEPWPEVESTIKKASAGKPIGVQPRIKAIDVILDLNTGTARTESLDTFGIDFPCYDERYTGYPTSHLITMTRSDTALEEVFGFNQVQRYDRTSASLQLWDYGPDIIAEEHIFIPDSGTVQGRGWIAGTIYNWITQRTGLMIFNAEQMQDGPIAQAMLPYKTPLGFHGHYVAS